MFFGSSWGHAPVPSTEPACLAPCTVCRFPVCLRGCSWLSPRPPPEDCCPWLPGGPSSALSTRFPSQGTQWNFQSDSQGVLKCGMCFPFDISVKALTHAKELKKDAERCWRLCFQRHSECTFSEKVTWKIRKRGEKGNDGKCTSCGRLRDKACRFRDSLTSGGKNLAPTFSLVKQERQELVWIFHRFMAIIKLEKGEQ